MIDKLTNSYLIHGLSSVYDDMESMSTQELISKIVSRLNIVIDKANEIDNKLDVEEYVKDITQVRKIDKSGNFTGSWFGIKTPSYAEETQAQVVENNRLAVIRIDNSIEDLKARVINVKDHGAIGDGATDDTEAIQGAIDFCYNNRLTYLYFPRGQYYVTKTLHSKGIKLIGIGYKKPDLLDWRYTRPTPTMDLYRHYLEHHLGGSIITTDLDITLFDDGLKAQDLMLFGHRYRVNQCGIKCNTPPNFIKLNNVAIVGFGNSGIKLDYGIINLEIDKSLIEQNGRYGIEFGKELGGYTGETNRITIDDTSFNRNEKGGLFGTILGRHTVINNCTFEFIGEPSDPERPKPTNAYDICYGINLNLAQNSGFSNGSMMITNNYSEETYGFIKLTSENTSGAITIKNNLWYPLDNNYYSCFCCLSGYISYLTIDNNNCYTQRDYVNFIDFNARAIICDLPTTGGKPNIQLIAPTGDKTSLNINIDNPSFMNYDGSSINVIASFPKGFITSLVYDSSFNNSDQYFKNGSTYAHYDSSKLNGFNIGGSANYDDFYWSGCALIVGGQYFGIISGHTGSPSLLNIRGDISNKSIGDGSAQIVQVSGFSTINGAGKKIKVVYDYDNTPLHFGF